MTDNAQFTAAEQSEIAAHAENAKKVLGLGDAKPGEAQPDAGQAPKFVAADEVNMAAGLAALREQGLSEPVIEEFATGKPISAADRALAEGWLRDAKKSPAFIKELLSGEPEAQKKMLAASIALSAEIQG